MFTIFWFRRDLRIKDNIGLFYALKENHNVLPIFIFDMNILKDLPSNDKRVNLIFDRILYLKNELEKNNSSLLVFYGIPEKIHKILIEKLLIKNLYFNEDFEPYPLQRDEKIKQIYKTKNIQVFQYLDHIFFKPEEILNTNQKPYQIYSQYAKKWLEKFSKKEIKNYQSEEYLKNLIQKEDIQKNYNLWIEILKENKNIYINLESLNYGKFPDPLLEKMNFKKTDYLLKPLNLNESKIKQYHQTRDYPSLEMGTTNSSVYLRFGLESYRKILFFAKNHSFKLLQELIWREFFIMSLYFYPKSIEEELDPKFLYLRELWRNPDRDHKTKEDFEKWKEGKTGFPIIDAGMRELKETGYLHNRVRMICASFLVKNLLIDWKFGERHFALLLMDFELASNVGNWQWIAGTGYSSPYFRIFNPTLQQKKFDPNYDYCKKWIPELNSFDYLNPMIEYKESKNKILKLFSSYSKNLKK